MPSPGQPTGGVRHGTTYRHRRENDFSSRHPQGANFLFADGWVRPSKDPINPAIWNALATREGGEIVSAAYYL